MEINSADILPLMEQIKKNIEDYPLEKKDGTKKMLREYHRRAVETRNAYVEAQKKQFLEYEKQLYQILKQYESEMIPPNKEEVIEEQKKEIQEYYKLIRYQEKNKKLEEKLGYTSILLKMKDQEHIDLDFINTQLKRILTNLEEASIQVKAEDFNNTMFTRIYMENFLEKRDLKEEEFLLQMKDSFENIYWECPNLITHLRLGIEDFLAEHQKELENHILQEENNALQKLGCKREDCIPLCIDKKRQLKIQTERNLYETVQSFFSQKWNIADYQKESSTRKKLYQDLWKSDDFESLTEEKKKEFYNLIRNFSEVLTELEGYYEWEKIIQTLIGKYKNRETFKKILPEKQKELEKLEKDREKLQKQYQSLQKPRRIFGKKKARGKGNALKLQMNQLVNNIETLKEELVEHEMNDKILKTLNDDSTLLEVLILLNSDEAYLKKVIEKENPEIKNEEIFDKIEKFFDYCYCDHPFLKNITVLNDINIADAIYDKYRLLNLNFEREALEREGLPDFIKKIEMIKRIEFLEESVLPPEKLEMLCNLHNLKEIE